MLDLDDLAETINLPDSQDYVSQKLLYLRNWFSKHNLKLVVDRFSNNLLLLLLEKGKKPQRMFGHQWVNLKEDDFDYEVLEFSKKADKVLDRVNYTLPKGDKVNMEVKEDDEVELKINGREVTVTEGDSVVVSDGS